MAQSSDPVPSAPATQRPNRRRLWIALGILDGVIYVAFQALSGAAALYLSTTNMSSFTYAPAAGGMEARFIIAATREPRSLLDFFGGTTSNLTAPQLPWTPAPS
jgi:hypothetical protein